MVSDDDDDKLFLWYRWPTKGVSPYFHPGPLSEILIIANLRHTASRIWMKLVEWSCVVVITTTYTTAPHLLMLIEIRIAYMVKYNSATPIVTSYLYKFERRTKIFLIQMETIFFYNIFLFVFEQNIIY